MTSSRDTYTLGYNSAEQERMGRRTTTHSASFLLRRLRPGMRVARRRLRPRLDHGRTGRGGRTRRGRGPRPRGAATHGRA